MSDATIQDGISKMAGLTPVPLVQYTPGNVISASRNYNYLQDASGVRTPVHVGLLDEDLLLAANDTVHALVNLAAADTSLGQAMAALNATMGAGNALQTARNLMATGTNVRLDSILAQEQSNGTALASILASLLRQEANQIALAAKLDAIDADAKAASTQAHADALAELARIDSTNAALATAHADAAAELSATNAAATQAHQDAQAFATALGAIHVDDVATKAALDLLHTDENGLLAVLQQLLGAAATENATLSAISLTDQSVLAVLKAILAGGTPFSLTMATAQTGTLLQAGSNGANVVAMGAACSGLLTSVTGLGLLTVFSTASSTGASGSVMEAVQLTAGTNAPMMANEAVPANYYVRATNVGASVTVFGAYKNL